MSNTPIPEKNRKLLGGKFKITNMADDQVDLTPEDIPGASNEKEVLDHPASSHRKKDWKRH